MSYQPKTGAPCACKPGVQRDNCPTCEGTGWVIDFAVIRARRTVEIPEHGIVDVESGFWVDADGNPHGEEPDIPGDRARDQRATGPSPEEERRARGLDEEQGTYRAFS